jgi:DNA-binding LytR/AlgR family response regulator
MHAVSKSTDHPISHRRWRNNVSNGEDAVQTFDKAALEYILSDPRTSEALRRLVRAPTDPVPRLHYVRAALGQLIYQIAVDDVLFFHAENKYTVVKTPASEHLIRTPVAELVKLLDSDQFWQVHRSTLVNLKYLVGIRRDRASRLFVQIRGHDQELPVSRAHAHLFKAM